MAESSYDCIVIGSGPGGYVAAIRAAQLGLKTAIVENDRIGGRCLNYACIPAKAVLRVADILSEIDEADEFGIAVDGRSVDFGKVGERRKKVVSTLTGGVGGLMKKNKIDVLEGTAALGGKGSVTVDGKDVETKNVVIATGSVSVPIPGTSFDGRVVDTAGMWLLNEQPARLAVIGAGASGSEIASAFGRYGTEVVLIEMLDQILPAEDPEIAKAVASAFRKQNVQIVTGARVEQVKAGKDSVELDWGDGAQTFDYLCICAGRAADTEALNLEAAGVKTGERGLIEVDDRLRTSADGVWAIGDVVPGPALAHKASDEGIIAVEDAAGMDVHPLDYEDIAAATFCSPQVASFGLTEQQARDRGADVVVGKFPMGGVGAPTVYGDRTGFVKIVGDKRYGELLGAHIVGVRATEMIAELIVAKELEGGFEEVARTVHPHPTFSEAVMESARATAGWVIHG
jgi:dihydrolipoamide dehydrogenase